MSEDVKIPLPKSLQEIVGALLFASESPLSVAELKAAIRAVGPEEGDDPAIMDVYRSCTTGEVTEALRGLEKALEVSGVGFKLVCTDGSYRLQTIPSCGRYVRAMLKLDRPSRLSRASLETLAIIAYRQPLTKSEIEEIRGVDVTNSLKMLMELQLIRLVGKSELPGHPFLYGTTPLFLEHFGLASLQQLNELDPTLQRSNPRKKAEQYKRPVKSDSAAETLGVEAEASEGVASEEAASEEAASTEEPQPTSEDDDVVIDDTPDEFDDDDDDDEEEEEAENEECADDSGASDADGV